MAKYLAYFIPALLWALPANVQAREQIKIVGSSTMFPFSSVVAEHFGRTTKYRTPIVESTGTGGGFKLFCAGIGENHPDITNASRRIKKSEFETCKSNRINITEVKTGFDGIVLATAKSGQRFKLTRKQIFQALAARVPVKGKLHKNPYRKWSDIDKSLPNIKIEVLGPPPTSGTRDAFVEQAMEGGAKKFKIFVNMRKKDKKKFKAIAHAIRQDGAFIEAGENDNLIVQKLLANKNALGIFGFSFLDNNSDQLQGALVEGIAPSFDKIAAGEYPISRSLFFYVKKNHVGIIPGIQRFVQDFTSPQNWGDDGRLAERGLIPLPAAQRRKTARSARNFKQLQLKELLLSQGQ